jgi:chromosome segregation ATPase
MPIPHSLLLSLAAALLTFLATWYWRSHDAGKARRAAELAAAAQAEADRLERVAVLARLDKLEQAARSFMPENDIREELLKLGRDIAENQAKIKTQHDRGEDVANALNQRVSTLEQHHTALTQLPSEVTNLKTDHRVLAAKVDGLVQSVQGLDRKQDEHFSKLMDAVSNLSYTRGQLSSRRRPPSTLPE